MDDRTFRARYRDTPLDRPGRDGFLRNLCVGLGNSGSREAAPVLCRAAEDRSPLVRAHAVWALGRIGTDDARASLEARLESEADPLVREELELACEPRSASGGR